MEDLKAGFKQFAAAMRDNLPNAAQSQAAVVREEALVLYNAYKADDQKEILDGIVDTLFTGFVFGRLAGANLDDVYELLNNFNSDRGDKTLREYYFDLFVNSMKQFTFNYNIVSLQDVMRNVIMFALSYKHDVIGALNAVVAENLTKLQYPEDKRDEVWRNNKLQKKDQDGNLYPWYQPAKFANYLRYTNIFDLTDAIILDTETTGLDDNAEIVQIAIIDGNGNQVVNELVKPSMPIPAAATNVHGITDDMVANVEPWKEINNFIIDELKSVGSIYIYNADYDTRLIKQTAAKYNLPVDIDKNKVFCVMRKYAELWGELVEKNGRYQHRWISLVTACEQQGIDVSDLKAHDALNDSIKTLRLMQKLNTGDYNTFKG